MSESSTSPLGRLGSWLMRRSQAKESGAYQGVLSYAAEWHALAVGVGVGVAGTPGLRSAVVAYALGVGGGKRIQSTDAHVRDVADEPAYALAGLSAGSALRGAPLATVAGALPI